jgi:hypothetical protein
MREKRQVAYHEEDHVRNVSTSNDPSLSNPYSYPCGPCMRSSAVSSRFKGTLTLLLNRGPGPFCFDYRTVSCRHGITSRRHGRRRLERVERWRYLCEVWLVTVLLVYKTYRGGGDTTTCSDGHSHSGGRTTSAVNVILLRRRPRRGIDAQHCDVMWRSVG